MKKLLNNLAKNKGYFSLTLLVGIIFSGISVLTPTVSGDMITAFTEDASAGSRFLILYLLVGLCQIVFSLLDAYMGMQFQLRQKRMMRSNVFRTFSKKDSVQLEQQDVSVDTTILEAYAWDCEENTLEINLRANMGKQRLSEGQQGWLVLDYENAVDEDAFVVR